MSSQVHARPALPIREELPAPNSYDASYDPGLFVLFEGNVEYLHINRV